MDRIPDLDPAYVSYRSTAPAYWLAGTLWFVHAGAAHTGASFTLMEQDMPQGLGPPAHRHLRSSEGFYVVEGRVLFHAEGKTVPAGAGTAVHIPRGLPHTFEVESTSARVLNYYTPAGFEACVMSLARPAPEPWMMEAGADASAAPLIVGERGPGALVTLADYDLLEIGLSAGDRLPAGRTQDRHAIYVLEGRLDRQAHGAMRRLDPGDFAWLPRNATATVTASETARALLWRIPMHGDPA